MYIKLCFISFLVGSTDFFTLSEFKSKLSVALSKGLDIPDTRCVLQSLVTFDPCKRQIICQSCDLIRWEAVSNSFHVYSNWLKFINWPNPSPTWIVFEDYMCSTSTFNLDHDWLLEKYIITYLQKVCEFFRIWTFYCSC